MRLSVLQEMIVTPYKYKLFSVLRGAHRNDAWLKMIAQSAISFLPMQRLYAVHTLLVEVLEAWRQR